MDKSPDCPNRREEYQLVPCVSCGEHVQVKVYQCTLHGECTLTKRLDGFHLCEHSYLAKAEQQAPSIQPTRPRTVYGPVVTGTLLEGAEDKTTVSVRLDTGRTIQATNQKRLEKKAGIRCIVSEQPTGWLLVQ